LKITHLLFYLFISLPLISGYAQQQYYTKTVRDTIPVNLENKYRLTNPGIIPHSEQILLRGKIVNKENYTISYSTAVITLSDTLPYSVFDTLFISYEILDVGFKKEYKRRSLVYKLDEETGDTVRVLQSDRGGFTPDAIFGSNMEKSGTLIRGFTVGTTKDFTLSSGLRLQLSGNLSEDIELVAALTDENTPIQPEGNTERLEELDKVFIQIKHPLASGIFGDYQMTRRTGEFGFIDRKLQGLTGEFRYDDYNAYVSLAGSKGRFNTNNFRGLEGVQGPYRLSGINNERDIIIIAGTEKVYIDGIEMRRGEANDYVIEYSNAQLTFTPKRLITSASRITIDFEYTDRRYTRNFFGAGAGAKLFDDKLTFQMQFIQEGDDPQSPIDITLNDEDRAILSAAGDDRIRAVRSGVIPAVPDSAGIVRGVYQQVDTVIGGLPYTYYVYNPGDPAAVYNLNFSFVGEQQGDYARQSVGHFRFVGVRRGSYMPVVFIPLPELKQIGNAVLTYTPEKDINLSFEYAGSLFDRNRLSSLDESDNFGSARNITLSINPKEVSIGKLSLGRAGITYKDRFVQERFTSADRINEIEFNRIYNTGTTTGGNEQLRELNLTLLPIKELQINSLYGFLGRGEDFRSDRFNNTLRFGSGEDYAVNYNFDYVVTDNLSFNSTWVRQRGDASYKIWKLRPGVEFLAEKKKDKLNGSDSLGAGSLKYNEITPFLDIIDLEGIRLSSRLSLRDEYLPLEGILFKESKSVTQSYELNYSGIREVNTTLNLVFRERKYTEEFRRRGFLNSETILVRSQSRFNLWEPVNGDLFYEVSTQRSARLERVFIQVEKGTGNYIYSGDLNNNGVADENEYEPALFDGEYIVITIPSDELFPVIDLKTSTRWKISLGEIFEEGSFTSDLLDPFSTETFWRVEENSTEQDYSKIYLLNFSSFLNEATTIRGSNFLQQDFFIFENDPELSFRLRYSQRESMNQYSGGMEKGYNRERSMRINFRLLEEIANQTDIVNAADNVAAPVVSNRKREINSNSITTDFSYRPAKNIEVGFKLTAARSEDIYPELPTVIDLNAVELRFNLAIAGSGRLRVEVERSELIANNTQNFIPFELTMGNYIGKNYFWRLNFDYRISSNLQSTLSYDGRQQAAGKVIHTGKAEVRAYF
jgi:hypothetical protein